MCPSLILRNSPVVLLVIPTTVFLTHYSWIFESLQSPSELEIRKRDPYVNYMDQSPVVGYEALFSSCLCVDRRIICRCFSTLIPKKIRHRISASSLLKTSIKTNFSRFTNLLSWIILFECSVRNILEKEWKAGSSKKFI